MVNEPRIWDIPAILGSFVISNAGIVPVVPYTGRVSPGFSGAAAAVPLLRPGHTPFVHRGRRLDGLALTHPRRESDQLDLSWMLVRQGDSAIDTPAGGDSAEAIVVEMLEAICRHAAEAGMVSLFARIPDEGAHKQVFEQHGFTCVVREHTYGRSAVASEPHAPPAGLREQESPDAWGIQQLYRSLTPALVQRAENLTSRTWDLPGRRCFPAFRRQRPDDRFVVDGSDGLRAWCNAVPGEDDAPHRIRLMVGQSEPGLAQAVLDFTLAWLRRHPRRSVLTTARDHETTLLRTLEENGFRPVYTRLLVVRHLAARLFNPLPRSVFKRAAN
ncbi:MAG: hypothetical protein QF719_08565 [Chloroflexota bacterium]|nr:hypothetical protein [Chloroflexota bacterium]MDP6758246.1 hypothetical protein [Chloroflexota bacterium]